MYKKLCFFECESKLLCVVALLVGAFRLVVVVERKLAAHLDVAKVVAHILQVPYCLVHLGGSRRNAHLCFLRQPRHYAESLHHPCALFRFHAFSFGLGICLDCVCDTPRVFLSIRAFVSSVCWRLSFLTQYQTLPLQTPCLAAISPAEEYGYSRIVMSFSHPLWL